MPCETERELTGVREALNRVGDAKVAKRRIDESVVVALHGQSTGASAKAAVHHLLRRTRVERSVAILNSGASRPIVTNGRTSSLAKIVHAGLVSVAKYKVGTLVPVGTGSLCTCSQCIVAIAGSYSSDTRANILGDGSSISADFVVSDTGTASRAFSPAAAAMTCAAIRQSVEFALAVRPVDPGRFAWPKVVLAPALSQRSGTVIVADIGISSVTGGSQSCAHARRVDKTVGVDAALKVLLSVAAILTVTQARQRSQ